MVDPRGSRGGRGGRPPRGRGRRGGRNTPVGPEARIPTPGADGAGDRVEIPIQQPVLVDPAALMAMVRAAVREIVVPPQADTGSAPVVQPEPAPGVQTPITEARSEGHTDWVKAVGQCRPPFFYGARGDDIEMWFREVEGVFDMVAVPEDVRFRLAAGLLRRDAFDSWTVRKAGRPEWTYSEFKGAMLREYSPPGVQTERESTFYSGSYDPTIPVEEVVRQFKRELVYCAHLCPTDASRIQLLTMRLSQEVRLHTSGLGDVTFDRFLEVVLRYERQRLRPAAGPSSSSSRQSGKRPRDSVMDPGWDPRARGGPFRGGFRGGASETPITSPASREEIRTRVVTCYGCHEVGHLQRDCPRAFMECHSCRGRGHRAIFCPRKGGSAPAPRLPEAPRPPQLTHPAGQGRGFGAPGSHDGGLRGRGDGGLRGGRGRDPVRETGQSSREAGRDDASPPPPRVFQLSAFEDDDPDPTSTGMIPIPC